MLIIAKFNTERMMRSLHFLCYIDQTKQYDKTCVSTWVRGWHVIARVKLGNVCRMHKWIEALMNPTRQLWTTDSKQLDYAVTGEPSHIQMLCYIKKWQIVLLQIQFVYYHWLHFFTKNFKLFTKCSYHLNFNIHKRCMRWWTYKVIILLN